MNADDLRKRTKTFSLRIIQLTETRPTARAGEVLARQLLRSGTSVGANYRSACRARSQADFIPKVGIAIEEADESLYWMELRVEAELFPKARLRDLMKEANELIAILTASARTAKRHLSNQKS